MSDSWRTVVAKGFGFRMSRNLSGVMTRYDTLILKVPRI